MDELLQQMNGIQPMSERDVYYGRTQLLLQALKLGTVSLDNLNVTPNGWSLAKPVAAETPAAPAPVPEG